MDRRWVGVALGVGLLGLALISGLAGGSPTEGMTICLDCVPEHEDDVTVEDSATHVYLRPAGDARVVARSTLSGAGVEALRDDEWLETFADGVARRHGGRVNYGLQPHARSDYEARFDGDTLVVSFRYEDFTERRAGGVTFSDGYVWPRRWGYTEDWAEIETDRLVVHPPNGTTPLVVPPNATTDGNTLVYHDGVSSRSYLVFGDDGDRTRARALIALDVAGWAIPAAAHRVFLAIVVLTCLAVFFAHFVPGRGRTATASKPRGPDRSNAVLGGVAVFLAFTLYRSLTLFVVHPGALPAGVQWPYNGLVPVHLWGIWPSILVSLGVFAAVAWGIRGYLVRNGGSGAADGVRDRLSSVALGAIALAVGFRLVAGLGSDAFTPAVPWLWADGDPLGELWAMVTVLAVLGVSLLLAGVLLAAITDDEQRGLPRDRLTGVLTLALTLAALYGVGDATRLVADDSSMLEAAQRVSLLVVSSVGLGVLGLLATRRGTVETDASPSANAQPDGNETPAPSGIERDPSSAGSDARVASLVHVYLPAFVGAGLPTAALTLLVAADYTATYAPLVGFLTVLGVVGAFVLLARLVEAPARTRQRALVVAAVPAIAWLDRFSQVVAEGPFPHGQEPILTPWTLVIPVVAVLGFYATYRWL